MRRKYASAARQNLRLSNKLETSPEEKINLMFGGTPMLATMLLCHHIHTVQGSTIKYTSNERIACFVIYYSLGASSYCFLRTHMKLRLPSLSAIHIWLSSLTFSAGWNDNLVEVIKDRVESMNNEQKECVLMWDEMSIKTQLEYDKYSDSLIGIKDLGNLDRTLDLATHGLIFMIRGLSAAYVFPVAYFFSANAMKTNDLLRVVKLSITKLSNLGLNIKIAVCDQGAPNQAIFKELGVNKSKPYIESDGKKIYFVFDTPHLIKSVRNNFQGRNIQTQDGLVRWSYIEQLYNLDNFSSVKLAPKLKRRHMQTNSFDRMRVYLATQLFSQSVSNALKTMRDNELIDNESEPTIHFINNMDIIFDILNTSSLIAQNKPFRSGKNGIQNMQKLNELTNWVATWKSIRTLPDKNNKLRFQRSPPCFEGLILTMNGIQMLYADLQTESQQFLKTRNIQQDSLEHFNSFMRRKSGSNTNPTAREFKDNFRFNFIHSLIKSPPGTNCELSEDNNLGYDYDKLKSIVNRCNIEKQRTARQQDIIENGSPDISDNEFEDTCSSESNDEFRTDCVVQNLFKLHENTGGRYVVSNCAAYIGNWITTKISRRTKCKRCALLFQPLSENKGCMEYVHLTHKLAGEQSNPHLQVIGKNIMAIFVKIAEIADKELQTFALNVKGMHIRRNILRVVMREEEISEFVKACEAHRRSMVETFLNSIIYSVVKTHKHHMKASRSFDDTIRDRLNY